MLSSTARRRSRRQSATCTARALIQRCQAHKARNVTDQLPEEMRPSVRQALRDAYRADDATRAKRMLGSLVRRLRDEHPGAAASLDEGLDETITVKRLGLSAKLERQLATTNAIENLIGSVRRIARRVKRWRGARMMMRWTVAAIADAATRFRCVMGTRDGMPQLVRALKDHESAVAIVAPRKQAA
ncbi:MAG TPA: transposase [Kofleriaceae bacterium]